MQVNAHVASYNVIHNLRRKIFRRRTVLNSREHTVHIKVEHRHTSRTALYSKWVDGRIYIHNTVKQLYMFIDSAVKLIAYILSVKLITMYSGHD